MSAIDKKDLPGQVMTLGQLKAIYPSVIEDTLVYQQSGPYLGDETQITITTLGLMLNNIGTFMMYTDFSTGMPIFRTFDGGFGNTDIIPVEMTLADTEYSVVLPQNVYKAEFTFRRSAKVPGNSSDVVRLAFETGQVVNGTGKCKTYTGDKEYVFDNHLVTNGGGKQVFFASSVANATMEVVVYYR